METQDTILRIIQQTALILRAFFNQLPQDPLEEKDLTDFTSKLKGQSTSNNQQTTNYHSSLLTFSLLHATTRIPSA